MRLRVLILALLALAAAPVAAHDISTSYGKVTVAGNAVRVVLTLDVAGVHKGPSVDLDRDGTVGLDELDNAIEPFWTAIKANYSVRSASDPTGISLERYALVSDVLVEMHILYTFDHEVTDLTITSNLDRITQPDHRHLLRIGEGEDVRQGILGADNPVAQIDYAQGEPFYITIWQFLTLGVEHIFTGYDHLAFLLGLLLTTTTLVSLIKVVTSFTVAHSITLALATFNLIALPSRLIESLIALSIAYVAVENFFGKSLVLRWKITFLFGLVHGFGFSNVLKEMELSQRKLALSLFSFNGGVEVGQLIFVAVVFPAVFYIGTSKYKEQFLSGSSLVIMSLGVYWFVQRALL